MRISFIEGNKLKQAQQREFYLQQHDCVGVSAAIIQKVMLKHYRKWI